MLSSIRRQPDADPIPMYAGLFAGGYPALLVWGEADNTSSLADMETVIEEFPTVEVYVVQRAGHLAHYERPDAVNGMLIDFLTRPSE
jgi:pimeloyl-ACP methyl ester carboxylesterase